MAKRIFGRFAVVAFSPKLQEEKNAEIRRARTVTSLFNFIFFMDYTMLEFTFSIIKNPIINSSLLAAVKRSKHYRISSTLGFRSLQPVPP